MDFVNFARDYGLIVNHIEYDKWVSTPTEDHPQKRNGRYKILGDVGWVQNWATMDKPVTWMANGSNQKQIRQQIHQSMTNRQQKAQEASSKAKWIMSQCSLEKHPYLVAKGFQNEYANCFDKGSVKLLTIPMYIAETMVGCQLIDEQGGKKFLNGQISKGASFIIGTKGTPIFCEGFATALSIRDTMNHLHIPYKIYVCFSASNIKFIARDIRGGFIIADNDANCVGERSAKETGKPYWLSDTTGEDFNDYHMRVGNAKASQALKKVLISLKT